MLQALKSAVSGNVRDVGGEFQANLPEFLRRNVVTAAPLGAPGRRQPGAGVSEFTLQQHKSNGFQAVALDARQPGETATAIRAYWVPQGGHVDVPVAPHAGEGTVFTPDFSGCSLYVDQLDAKTYRVYHVEGGKLQQQYTSQPHYLGLAAKWTEAEYVRAGNPRAFALMRYHDGQWWVYSQKQLGVRGIGLRDGRLAITEAQNVDGVGGTQVGRVAG